MYKLKVKNESGDSRNFFIYQKIPKLSGHSVAFISKYVSDMSTTEFSWEQKLGIGLGVTKTELGLDIKYETRSSVQQLVGSKNCGLVNYERYKEDGDFKIKLSSCHSLQNNQVLISTEDGFSTLESKHMHLSLYIDNKPVYIVKGDPSTKYLFTIHPVYYISSGSYVESDVIELNYMSTPYKLDFSNNDRVECVLTKQLKFQCSGAHDGHTVFDDY